MTPAQAEVEFRCRVPAPESSLVKFTPIRDSGGENCLTKGTSHTTLPTARTHYLNQYGGRLVAEGIKSMFQRFRHRTGVDRPHPHLLRHTAATRLLANGCDLHTVQRMIRQRNVTTTTRYLHLLNSDVHSKMEAFRIATRGAVGPRAVD